MSENTGLKYHQNHGMVSGELFFLCHVHNHQLDFYPTCLWVHGGCLI